MEQSRSSLKAVQLTYISYSLKNVFSKHFMSFRGSMCASLTWSCSAVLSFHYAEISADSCECCLADAAYPHEREYGIV